MDMRKKQRLPDCTAEWTVVPLISCGTEEEDRGMHGLVCGENNLSLVLEMLSWEGL